MEILDEVTKVRDGVKISEEISAVLGERGEMSMRRSRRRRRRRKRKRRRKKRSTISSDEGKMRNGKGHPKDER